MQTHNPAGEPATTHYVTGGAEYPAHRCLDCGAVLCENCAQECEGPRSAGPERLRMLLESACYGRAQGQDVFSESWLGSVGVTGAEQEVLDRALREEEPPES